MTTHRRLSPHIHFRKRDYVYFVAYSASIERKEPAYTEIIYQSISNGAKEENHIEDELGADIILPDVVLISSSSASSVTPVPTLTMSVTWCFSPGVVDQASTALERRSIIVTRQHRAWKRYRPVGSKNRSQSLLHGR